jgi:hypothetical protein
MVMIHFDWKKLSSAEFEDLCRDLLKNVGFQNVVRIARARAVL